MQKKLYLELFEKIGDAFIKDIDISRYDLSVINILCPPEDPLDVEYCDGHFVEEPEFNELQKIIVEMTPFSYSAYDFNLITRRL